MIAGAVTHTGRVRLGNEDFYYIPGKVEGLYVVADGMGGHNAGEVASRMAVMHAVTEINAERGKLPVLTILRNAVHRANHQIFLKSESQSALSGMGTTLTLALWEGERLYIAHIGDSRAYKLHEGGLRQITNDHTLLHELLLAGEITEQEALTYPHRHVITRALGTDLDPNMDLFEEIFDVGDTLLLCSDGLTEHVTDEEIESVLASPLTPQGQCERLLEMALARGGKDNITIVVVRREGREGK